MVIAYLRVSTEKQCLENQHNEISRYAQMKSLIIDKWVTEVVSGKTNRNNRKLGSTLKKLKRGDILIVTEISRLSRSLHEIMEIMGKCLTKNITIYSTKDGYAFDDSINSKVLSFAFGLVAEIERNLISQRTKEALALRKAQGMTLGRKFGTTPKMNLLHNKREEIINLIDKGVSIESICKKMGVAIQTFRQYRTTDTEINNRLTIRKQSKKN